MKIELFGFELVSRNTLIKTFNGQEVKIEFNDSNEYTISHPLRDSKDTQHYRRVKQLAQTLQQNMKGIQ